MCSSVDEPGVNKFARRKAPRTSAARLAMLFNDYFIKLRGHPDLMARLGGRQALVDRLIDADEQSTRMIAASRKAGAALNQDAAFGRSAARLQQRGAAMDIKRNGSQPSAKGPADWFTGVVRI